MLGSHSLDTPATLAADAAVAAAALLLLLLLPQPMGMVSPVFQSEGGAEPSGGGAKDTATPGAAAGASLGL
jgi:hypothetical protein